jgi:hypothetical protein
MHRWRPIYEAEAVRDGKRERYFLKGERTWPTHPYPLKYECDVQRVLSQSGIGVPEIVAWIPDPATIVMEWIEGGRDAGLIQQAIESGSQMTPERWQASLTYMDRLAEVHAIPWNASWLTELRCQATMQASCWLILSGLMRWAAMLVFQIRSWPLWTDGCGATVRRTGRDQRC